MNPSSHSADATSPSLLARVQANQPGSWERLVDLYGPLIYYWCRRSALSPEDAADVFQEVFRSVAEHIAGFRRDRAGATFRGWLRTITRNKIHDHFRRAHDRAVAAGGSDAQRWLLAVPAAPEEEDAEEAGLLHQQVRRAVEALRGEFEPRTWQAFWKVQMEGESTADVGAELDMTAAAVRKAKLRVLRRLREELGDLLE
ncbi:MAG TPA: sigma-70 family RNA polymerase sigma factor [Gemmataceae bacterium]|nr:sigma-70 family RNA polymerase sigma factor [Gemmataceae bacterium]